MKGISRWGAPAAIVAGALIALSLPVHGATGHAYTDIGAGDASRAGGAGSESGALALTGSSSVRLLGIGVVLVITGVALLVARRSRSRVPERI